MLPSGLTGRKKRILRVSPERARLPGRLKTRAENAPLTQRWRKSGLLVLHALLLFLIVLSAFPELPATEALIGLALLAGALHYLAGLYLVRFHRECLESFNRCLAAAAISAGLLLMARIALLSDWPTTAVPVGVGTLLFTLVLAQRFASAATAFLMAGLVLVFHAGGREVVTLLVVLGAGALVASLTVGRVRKRSTLIRVGVYIGLTQVIVGLGLALYKGQQPWSPEVLTGLGWFLCHGFLVGFIVSGLLPVVEFLFGVTTDVSLLELSNQNEQPVLRKLLIEAPGTFHHSFIVGLLAEAGAERIGAHGLLCRVGAYFHDIGKMVKPHYYAENMDLARSTHEALSPEMSVLVIASHPKDSLALADYYDLPPCVRPFMTEHHGTSKIEYFYQRALERAAEKGTPVDEASFRYNGPKPQSKETAIVMLADTVEAAVRALPSPTPSRIASTVHELIMKRLQDGQLDECPLTLRDIKEVEEAFNGTLYGIHHARPIYPAQQTPAETAS